MPISTHLASTTSWLRVIVAVLGLLVPADAWAQQNGTLRGRVTIDRTGVPAAGATVAVAGRQATTDARGFFEIADVSAGEHDMEVRHHSTTVQQRVRIQPSAVTALQVALRLPSVHEQVTVAGVDVRDVMPLGIEGTPGAASRLTGYEIQQYRPFTMHEALGFLPGVRTIDDDALGRRSGIGVRGAPPRRSRRVLLLEDGVPINAATYLDPSAHYTPPLDRLDGVDVLKGAGQIVHGPLNNHGIINFRTLQPTIEPRTTVDAGFGTVGNVRRHVRHTRTIGPAGVALAYSGVTADGVFDSEDHRYDDLFGGMTWAVSPRHDVSGSVTYFRERSHYDERNLSLSEYAEDPRGKLRLGGGVEFNAMAVNYAKSQVTHLFRHSDDVTFTSHVFVTDLNRPRFESRRGGPLEDGGHMRGRERRYTTFGAASHIEFADSAARTLRGTWKGGLRWERQRFDNRNTVGAVGEFLTPGNRGTLAVQDGVTFREDGRREMLGAWALSGFLQNTIDIGRAAITPGVRIERYTQARTIEFRPGFPTPDRETDARTLVLPGVGVTYEVEATTQAYAGIHRGYSPAIARTEEFPLVPETGVDMQVGLRSRRLQAVTFDVAAFYNLLQNTLVKRTYTDEFGANIFINSGDSHVRGFDASVRFDSQMLTGAPLNAFVHAVYGLADARFTDDPLKGNWVPEVARHSGRISAGVEHTAGWSVSLSVSRMGRFFSDEVNTVALTADPDDPLVIGGLVPGHTVISARGNLPVRGTGLALWIHGHNLANRLYISDVQDGLRPGQGRTVSAGLALAF